jgi:mono/diheme cytochrome c family protein
MAPLGGPEYAKSIRREYSPMPSRLAVHVTLVALLLVFPTPSRTADPPKTVDFDRDVKPIFAKHCVSCHGPEKAKSSLRLDRKADALAGGDGGAIIISGKSADSRLIKLVSHDDPDLRMPPKGARLTAAEIAILQAWIDQGAKWPDDGSVKVNPADWWSFKPLKKATVPAGTNPVDHFIRAKLSEKGLSLSKEADRRTLIRRVYFDLIGLPPTPDEVDAFMNSKDANAYEKLVDKLLASPHYGEHWARHWLDVVHFGETHGYDKDKPRPNAWPYRDYVIRAFNTDKPYSRFVAEQVAGDVLYPGTVDGIEALGFLSAGPWDFIGHAEVPESKIDGKIARHLDRDDFVSNTIGTFMGLTVHCAQCHNHKFDPISQEDYYRLHAVFAAIDRTDKSYDAEPKVAAKRAELEAKKIFATKKLTALEADARKKAGPELAAIEMQIAESTRPANAPKPPEFGYHSQLSAKQEVMKWVQVDLNESVTLDRIVIKPCHDDFKNIGAGFGFPVRFKIELSDDATFKTGAVIAGETANDFTNPGMAAYSAKAEGKSGRYIRVTATKLAPRQNDFMLALAELEAIDADGKNRARGKTVTALDTIEAPVRWRKSNLTDGLFPSGPKLAAAELAKLTERRDLLLKNALGEKGIADVAGLRAELTATDADLAKLAGSRRVAYVGAVHTGSGTFVGTGAQAGKPRAIHILPRGDVTKPGREVGPGAIAAIPGINGRFELPPNHTEGDRRAALAKWVTDPNNPLTWRVMANRVWQYHFGRGLVDTPSDFGKMGQLPPHPELLDYLAMELRDHQSLKKLHKLIVMSDAYRQVSTSNEAGAKVDEDNRYLWRQNRRKLEAEAVRDSILFVAGKLDLTMGGPSFQDFVVEKPEHSPHYQYHLHDPEDAKAHRRAVYRFVVRSKQQPFMAALDCADPSLAVEKRNETQTPQQALALLNNKLVVAMAKHFAARVEKLGNTDAERVAVAIRIALGRDPTAKERDVLASYAKEFGLANACRVILNLNEFVFVD